MRTSPAVSLVFVASLLAWSSPASADSGIQAEHVPRATHHTDHNSHLALFLGATYTEESAADLTLGLEYEYRLPMFGRLFGTGPEVEYVNSSHKEFIAIDLFYVHPWRSLKLFGGPGYERVSGTGGWLVRGGASYDVHVGSLSLSPTIAVDRFDEYTAVIGGVAAGFGI